MKAVEGWKNKKLIELAEYINGYAFKPDDWEKDGLPIIRIEQLKNPDATTDYYSGKLPTKNIVENGDLIFSWSASLFLRIWRHDRAALNQHLFRVVEREGIDRVFLKLFIEFYLPELTKASHGSTMQHITRKELDRFNAPFPTSKPEQTKIAEILSTVDRAIEQTEALIAKQQRIKTGLMQDLLTHGIDEHGNLRSEQTHEFKDSLLKGVRIPISWIDGEFRKVTSVNQGLQIPIEKRFKEEGPNRHKYITVQYLNNPDKYLEYIEKPPFQLVCSEGDILFTRTGNTGQIITGVEGVYHNNFFKVAYDKTKVYGDYLVQFLNWQPIQELIRELAGTTTIPDLNHGDFYSLPLFLPQIDEQKLISELLRTQNADLSTESRKLAKLRSLKTALMQDLLTGKKRVTTLLEASL
jgi:type I restriction enzyme S subunit